MSQLNTDLRTNMLDQGPTSEENRGEREEEMGNTVVPSPLKKQPVQLKNHFFTWFVEPEEVIEARDLLDTCFHHHCLIWAYQLEKCPTTEKLHIQGTCTCKKPMRRTEFGLPNTIHWEKVRNILLSLKYCTKEETRIAGPWVHNYKISKPIVFIEPNRQYQTFILGIIEGEPDPRSIHWFFDRTGNVGKSAFCKYLVGKKGALFIDEGTKANIVNMVYNFAQEINLIVVDVPRANKNKVSYKSLEAIKNGMIMNTKYETGQKMFNPPHIIVFSNFPPDVNNETVSADRMLVYEITQVFFEAVAREEYEYNDQENIAPRFFTN